MVNSTDTDLHALLEEINKGLSHVTDLHTFNSALHYASSVSAIHLGEALLKQTAMLLPKVYAIFKDTLVKITSEQGIPSEELPSHAWLRSQLSTHLDHHMSYQCSIMRYGTLLYRFGGDLVHALSVALGSQSHTENPRENDSLSEICSLKCHAHIKKLIAQDAESPHLIENFEVDEFIDSIDPILWKAVCIITKPSSTKAIKRDSSHVRKVQRLFLHMYTSFYHK